MAPRGAAHAERGPANHETLPILRNPQSVIRNQKSSYITRCYGSLTTFNILFKNKDDQFRTSAVDRPTG
jgi:hypothetical protein